MSDTTPSTTSALARIATLNVRSAELSSDSSGARCSLKVQAKDGSEQDFVASGSSAEEAIERTVGQLCIRPLRIAEVRRQLVPDFEADREQIQFAVRIEEAESNSPSKRQAVGRFVAEDTSASLLIATLRAASNAGLLKAAYRANNQKFLRGIAHELVEEQWRAVASISDQVELPPMLRLEIEAIALEHLNQAASAAVVTATNHPQADSILSLFDTSAWLFNRQGLRRDAYTDTELWLAWYPGVENNELNLGEVIESMPVTPDLKVPWIVRLFENPKGWIRFRGAVDLEDHDVLHVLLGRGLQDQDEAFVVGFAMGTAKKKSTLQFRLLRLALTYLYPEPYRIPKFLMPAFDLGFECGQVTGAKDLYRQDLKNLRSLSLGEARRQAGIDMSIVLKFYEREQQAIPFTIASLRLP